MNKSVTSFMVFWNLLRDSNIFTHPKSTMVISQIKCCCYSWLASINFIYFHHLGKVEWGLSSGSDSKFKRGDCKVRANLFKTHVFLRLIEDQKTDGKKTYFNHFTTCLTKKYLRQSMNISSYDSGNKRSYCFIE